MRSFRLATADDLPLILEMAREFTGFFAEIDPETPPLDGDRMARSLGALCFGATPHGYIVIGSQNGTPVGYAVYNYSFWADSLDAVLFLSSLFIRTTARGDGWGQAFMEHLQKTARDTGCGRVMWNVWDRNTAAITFYQRLGARMIADEPVMYLEV
jgi:GNAT superfamily N-acetyltransferase